VPTRNPFLGKIMPYNLIRAVVFLELLWVPYSCIRAYKFPHYSLPFPQPISLLFLFVL
jgi:hypothetical protein